MKRPYRYVRRFKEKERKLLTPDLLKEALPSAMGILKLLLPVVILAYLAYQGVIMVSGLGETPMERPVWGEIHLELKALELISGKNGSPVARFVYEITGDFPKVQLNVSFYEEPPPTQVFLLDHPSYETTSLPTFVMVLREGVEKAGIGFAVIHPKDVKMLSGGAVLVVPTGYLPEFLRERIIDLASRGNIIVYIGRKWDMCIDERGVIKPCEIPEGISFFSTTTSQGEISHPEYRVSGAVQSGDVSVLRLGEGAILFFPQTLDSGFSTGSAAGELVVQKILEMPWAPRKASFSGTFKKGEVEIFVENAESGLFYRTVVERLGIKTYDSGILPKTYPGTLRVGSGSEMVPFSVSQAPTRFVLFVPEELHLPASKLIFKIYQMGREVESSILFTSTVPAGEISFNYPLNLEQGNYTGVVLADSYPLAAIWIEMASLRYEIARVDQRTGEIVLKAFYGSQEIPLQPTEVLLDDSTSFYVDARNPVIRTGGLDPGKHRLVIKTGNFTQTIEFEVASETASFLPPGIQYVVGIAVLIVVVSRFVRLPAKKVYKIDIPDFPPFESKRIKVKAKEVLKAFEKANEKFGWVRMPLQVSEIKEALREILKISGNLVLTDYNVEHVLFSLEGRKLVHGRDGYFAPSHWGPITALVIFRKIREMCLEGAIPFVPPEKLDWKAMKLQKGEEILLVPYWGDESLREILKAKGRRILVLLGPEDAERLEKRLLSPDELAGRFRAEMEAGKIEVMELRELREVLLK